MIGCTREYVYYLIKTGDKYGFVEAEKFGDVWLVEKDSVEEYLRQKKQSETSSH